MAIIGAGLRLGQWICVNGFELGLIFGTRCSCGFGWGIWHYFAVWGFCTLAVIAPSGGLGYLALTVGIRHSHCHCGGALTFYLKGFGSPNYLGARPGWPELGLNILADAQAVAAAWCNHAGQPIRGRAYDQVSAGYLHWA
jgi:hypothetical protein